MKLRNPDMLRMLMTDQGLSYRDVHEITGIHWTFIHQLAKGNKTTCTPRRAEILARALRVDVTVLFEPKLPTATSETDTRSKAA